MTFSTPMNFPGHYTRSEPTPPPAPEPPVPEPVHPVHPDSGLIGDLGLIGALLGLPLTHPGLSPSRVRTLLVLDRLAAVTPGELSERVGVAPPSMTRTLTLLEERSLTARQPYPTDKRLFVVVLTNAGRNAVRGMHRDREERLAARLAGLSGEERAVLVAAGPVLGKLLHPVDN